VDPVVESLVIDGAQAVLAVKQQAVTDLSTNHQHFVEVYVVSCLRATAVSK
jgi:hypothetical protein